MVDEVFSVVELIDHLGLGADRLPSPDDWRRIAAELRHGAEVADRARRGLEVEAVRAACEVTALRTELTEWGSRLRFALGGTGTGLFEIGLASGAVTADLRASELFGFTEELTDPTIEDVRARMHAHDQSVLNQLVRQLLRSEPVVDFQFRVIRSDGAVRHIGGRASVERGVGGRPERIVGLISDVSQRVTDEAERQQSQKLESIGQLASGIAHEINTPVQFVSDSLHFVREATSDLLALVGRLQLLADAVATGTAMPDQGRACLEAADDADVDYLAEQMPRAIDRAADGLARVATIVRSMKEFAHPDQKEMTAVDLNRGIESTLTIARNEYKYVAEVETEFGDLPLVTCHPGAINQVVLNVVVNAAHAIGDQVAGTDEKGCISVQTHLDDDHAVIAITDTGGGIPLAIRHRVFDPFFTTKEVGRGTGQGLALARKVVEEHGGTIGFHVVDGVGTTFVLRIPVQPSGRHRARR